MFRRFVWAMAAVTLAVAAPAHSANIIWTGGNGTWNDGSGNNSNWSPSDEPDFDDVAIFNANDTIDMGSNNEIAGLTMSASAALNVIDHVLTINGPTTITGADTRLFLDGGSIGINQAGAPIASIATATSGTFMGNGDVTSTESIAVATTIFDNNGTLSATNPVTLIITPPAVATLHFTASDADARIDLDGSAETGIVSVGRNQTLDIDITVSDIFNGDMSMFQNSKLDIAGSWILGAGATIDVDNGATGGIGGAPAGVATIAGGSFSQNSGTITVVDADGTLRFDAPFTLNGGTLTNNGHVIFNQTATIGAAANFDMVGDSDLTVEANRTVTINQTNFNLDGGGVGGTVITVNSQGVLILSVTDYDSDAATNAFDGTINLTNGDISVTTGDAEFVMDGTLNMLSSIAGQLVAWTGEPFDLGNDIGSLDADLNVTGDRQSQFGGEVDFNSDADVDVAAGATLALLSTVNFNTVNAANNAQFTGAGRIVFSGVVNVNEAVTLNMVGGEIDLDGLDSVGDFVNVDAPLVINAATMAAFGRNNGGGGVNTLDINNNVGTGVLTVNLDNANDEWTLNQQGVVNLVNDNTAATLVAGNDLNINGTVNVTGDVRITARVDIGSTGDININTAGQPLRLAGGDNVNDVNTISGATIDGVGQIGADTGKALHGYGTINADVAFEGLSNLRASGGTLTINGDIVQVNIIGTADDTGILNVTNPWETDGGAGGLIGGVSLNGGTLQGATITNDNPLGIQGRGLVTTRVINDSQLLAVNGGTMIVETAGNDNDWDGATNAGELEALSGNLEIRDNATFLFGGTVRASNDMRVYTKGFGMQLQPGSALILNEGTFQSDESTALRGTVTVGAGDPSTINVQNNRFLEFETGSATTLNGDVILMNNNINIEQGATFSGTGALIVPDGSHVVADNQANIGVLVDMQGAFRPGNSQGIGRVDLFDFQESSTSELFVELRGTALNAFDRLVSSGDVIVDGFLSIDIDDVAPMVPFVPVLGNTFNIITGNTVTGTFDTVDVSGMPAGLAFHINYLANAVQLQVVNKPIFSADFDDDGDVDATDFAIWDNAYDLNQLGDADGDNDSDGHDFLLWQQQLGSKPATAVAGAVPEPMACGMIVVFMLSAAGATRRRR